MIFNALNFEVFKTVYLKKFLDSFYKWLKNDLIISIFLKQSSTLFKSQAQESYISYSGILNRS
jgi:hypothetical protein